MRKLAIIGTAGRDKTWVMDRPLWDAMLADARNRVQPTDILVSGGAAWADHLAVELWAQAAVAGLILYLPAPLERDLEPSAVKTGYKYEGPAQSAGAIANYYHAKFLRETGIDGLRQLGLLAHLEGHAHLQVHQEPVGGVVRMFQRNTRIAKAADAVVAYTFGDEEHPAPGGTLTTWRQCPQADRVHVNLKGLESSLSRSRSRSHRYASEGG